MKEKEKQEDESPHPASPLVEAISIADAKFTIVVGSTTSSSTTVNPTWL
jgi:hypothetical protein